MRSQIPVICTPGKRTLKIFWQPPCSRWERFSMFMEAAGSLKIPEHPKRPVPSEFQAVGFDFSRNRVRIIRIKKYNSAYNQNAYGYAGADCTGYAGWAIYNTLETVSGKDGYVIFSTDMAYTLAKERKLGTWTQKISSCGILSRATCSV